jgi:tetratricopeptide (TPR) repeat protein
MREAFAHHAAGELEKAAAGYRRILALEPAHAEAQFLLGEIANRQGRHLDAIPLLERAVAARPDIAAFHFELGHAVHSIGRWEEALAHYEQTLKLDSGHVACLIGLGDALLRLQRHGESSEAFRAALRAKITGLEAKSAEGTPAGRRAIPRTTLCCVDCAYYDLAAYALRRTLQTCRFERALFFTDQALQVEGVETIRIPSIRSAAEYSWFMLKELDRYISSDFVLVIQYDGFVLDSSRWTDAFLDYDYIGARWQFDDGLNVGNGGFSLRSKRLLEALRDEEVEADQPAPEDMIICREYRPYLERRHGIRFAPESLADQFAFETTRPGGPTLGFHGVGHIARMVDMSEEEIARYDPGAMVVQFTRR